MHGASTTMKMNTTMRGNTSIDFVRYRNKINGTVWLAKRNEKSKIIEGEEYLPVFDPNIPNRKVIVAKHILEKITD